MNDGSPTSNFTDVPLPGAILNCRGIFAIDLDKDNDLDIVTSSYANNSLYALMNDGAQRFSVVLYASVRRAALRCASLRCAALSSSVSACACVYACAVLQVNSPMSFSLVDVNKDGVVDVVGASYITGTFPLLLGAGGVVNDFVVQTVLAQKWAFDAEAVDLDSDGAWRL